MMQMLIVQKDKIKVVLFNPADNYLTNPCTLLSTECDYWVAKVVSRSSSPDVYYFSIVISILVNYYW